MTVSEADVQTFADQIQHLFVPWQDAQVGPQVAGGRPDEYGNTIYQFDISLDGVPYPVSAAVGASNVVLTGPGTFVSSNPSAAGWVAKPSDEEPISFEATVPDPAGTDGDFVDLTITQDVPQVIHGAVSTTRAIRSA
jgi:hypothetical protein